MPSVVLDALTKVFERPGAEPVRALAALSLKIEDKESVALVGPSGSGKTTALRLIAGLDQSDSGTVSIGGTSMQGVAPSRRDVAMVFQNPALYPHMTVYENLAFGLRLRKCPRAEADRRIRDAAEMLGVTPLLGARPMTLSAGQRQRVALGRAIVRRAGVLLLDEPLANVDPSQRAQMRQEIADLRQALGTTMIYVTHDHLDAMMVGDRVAVLREGALQQIDPPDQLYANPANLFVAGFVGFPPMNRFEGVLVAKAGELFFEPSGCQPKHISAGGESVSAGSAAENNDFPKIKLARFPGAVRETSRTVIMGVRAEHIAPAMGEGTLPSAARAVLRARVISVQTLGADTYLRARCGHYFFVSRTSPLQSRAAGPEPKFNLDLEHACFFDPSTGEALR